MISQPLNFKELLELQRILDNKMNEKRENGFNPRERTELDIKLALDDEFQEWLKELPYEKNFKTWKQKEYSRAKELEEFVDILFFFLQYSLFEHKVVKFQYEKDFNYLEYEILNSKGVRLKTLICKFKEELWNDKMLTIFRTYLCLMEKRKFTKIEILETYYKKWQANMKRINKDWVIQE